MDSRDVTKEIRRAAWPLLREAGFESFTGRSAWRYREVIVDVVNFQSFSASLADAVGCTAFSFSVNLGIWTPDDAARSPKIDPHGRPRPTESECHLRERLSKSLSQPWFKPFSSRSTSRWPLSLRRHREGLRRVVRTDVHDREDIWYVLPDGTNLEEMVADACRAIQRDALPWFEESAG